MAAAFISSDPVVVISISLALPCRLIPLAPSRVNEPADVVRLEAAPASRLKPAPESIVIAPSASISIADTLEPLVLLAAIVITFVSPALAVIVIFVVSVLSTESVVPSIVTPALESISKLPTFISNTPVVVTSISLAFPCIFTPLEPSTVKEPELVLMLEAAPASMLTPAPASIVISPSASKSRLDDPEPLFVAEIVIVFVPAVLAVMVRLVVSVPSRDNVVPSIVTPAVTSISKVPTFISNEPDVVKSISLAFPCIFIPLSPYSVRLPELVDHVDDAAAVSVRAPPEFVTFANSAPPSVPE